MWSHLYTEPLNQGDRLDVTPAGLTPDASHLRARTPLVYAKYINYTQRFPRQITGNIQSLIKSQTDDPSAAGGEWVGGGGTGPTNAQEG